MSDTIPLCSPDVGERELAALREVLDSRWLTMGPQTEAFEAEFAAFLGVEPTLAVAVASCTAALHLALLGEGVGPGDEVVVPSLTFVATANAVRYTGAVPVFADVCGPHDLTMDPEDVARKLTPHTRAVIPMHYAGYACHMKALTELAHEHGLALVEDAAHAPGGAYGHKALGSIGDAGCFSFYSNKNMVTAEGGMVVCRREAVAEHVRRLRCHGMTHGAVERDRGRALSYDVVALGFNYRIDELRAAIGRVQLQDLPGRNRERRRVTAAYRRHLARSSVGVPFRERELERSACHIMPVVLPDEIDRDEIMIGLRRAGVRSSVHYPPIHQLTEYRRALAGHRHNLPRTEKLAGRLLTLPLYPAMTEKDVKRAAGELLALLGARGSA